MRLHDTVVIQFLTLMLLFAPGLLRSPLTPHVCMRHVYYQVVNGLAQYPPCPMSAIVRRNNRITTLRLLLRTQGITSTSFLILTSTWTVTNKRKICLIKIKA